MKENYENIRNNGLLDRTKTPEFAQFSLKSDNYNIIKRFSTRKNAVSFYEKNETINNQKEKVTI